jgi:hypothetical protein
MNLEIDPLLEVGELGDVVATPVSAQPVVVVQYRNRGVPSWLFFPLIMVVPLAAIIVYHRMVVERYRVQAAQANSLLLKEIQVDRASLPLVRSDPPPTTVLPQPAPGAASIEVGPDRSLASVGTPEKPVPGAVKEPAPAADGASPKADRLAVTPAPPTAGPPHSTGLPPVAAAADAPVPAADQAPRITLRSLLPNPFADGATTPRPPQPHESGGAGGIDKHIDVATATVARSGFEAGASGALAPGPSVAAAAAADPAMARMLAPLPTKEEAEREIQEEAARRQAEILASNGGKSAEIRSARLEEQTRFREELALVVQSLGNRGGPDIDALAKRYGYEFDKDRYTRAHHLWFYSRMTQKEKVRAVRALELPETVILDFLSDDFHPKMMARNGLRSRSEVRVMAAKQLLKYPLPGVAAAERPATAATAAAAPNARTTSPIRKSVVSSPR